MSSNSSTSVNTEMPIHIPIKPPTSDQKLEGCCKIRQCTMSCQNVIDHRKIPKLTLPANIENGQNQSLFGSFSHSTDLEYRIASNEIQPYRIKTLCTNCLPYKLLLPQSLHSLVLHSKSSASENCHCNKINVNTTKH